MTKLNNPIHLGITAGVLSFSMLIILMDALAQTPQGFDTAPAWNVLWIVTVAVLGESAVGKLKQ